MRSTSMPRVPSHKAPLPPPLITSESPKSQNPFNHNHDSAASRMLDQARTSITQLFQRGSKSSMKDSAPGDKEEEDVDDHDISSSSRSGSESSASEESETEVSQTETGVETSDTRSDSTEQTNRNVSIPKLNLSRREGHNSHQYDDLSSSDHNKGGNKVKYPSDMDCGGTDSEEEATSISKPPLKITSTEPPAKGSLKTRKEVPVQPAPAKLQAPPGLGRHQKQSDDSFDVSELSDVSADERRPVLNSNGETVASALKPLSRHGSARTSAQSVVFDLKERRELPPVALSASSVKAPKEVPMEPEISEITSDFSDTEDTDHNARRRGLAPPPLPKKSQAPSSRRNASQGLASTLSPALAKKNGRGQVRGAYDDIDEFDLDSDVSSLDA
ncbi:hypothetical protein BC830DRAFT_1174415 [Chytriomyces sp. MP71]|nr:hypothetical protein BC830DRAFT_1174415 [Chytriomyces sp. MP71]